MEYSATRRLLKLVFIQTFSTLQAAFLALSLNPEVVKKAHAELDVVVGPHRLPEPSDQESLIYINAIVLEALRWHTVVPLSVFHKTVDDDELQGYFIPAGTIVIPNTWSGFPLVPIMFGSIT